MKYGSILLAVLCCVHANNACAQWEATKGKINNIGGSSCIIEYKNEKILIEFERDWFNLDSAEAIKIYRNKGYKSTLLPASHDPNNFFELIKKVKIDEGKSYEPSEFVEKNGVNLGSLITTRYSLKNSFITELKAGRSLKILTGELEIIDVPLENITNAFNECDNHFKNAAEAVRESREKLDNF